MYWKCGDCEKPFNQISDFISHLNKGKCNVDVERLFNLGIITQTEYDKLSKNLKRKQA